MFLMGVQTPIQRLMSNDPRVFYSKIMLYSVIHPVSEIHVRCTKLWSKPDGSNYHNQPILHFA